MEVLRGLERVKICSGQELDGEKISEQGVKLDELRGCKGMLEEVGGWSEDITGWGSLEEVGENGGNQLEGI